MWPSTGKPGTTRHPSKLHLQSCRRPDIELSKFYRRSLSCSHYNRPNRSLPSAWNNTFLRNRSIFSRYLRTRVVPCFPVDGHICGPELPCSSIMCYSKELLDNIRYRVELGANVCKTNCLCIMEAMLCYNALDSNKTFTWCEERKIIRSGQQITWLLTHRIS